MEQALLDGAWDDGFREWAQYTDLDEAEFRALSDAGLVAGLDWYWHPDEGSVEFELPPIPDRIAGDGSLATLARSELSDLGETVTRLLEDAVDWTAEEL